MASFPHYGPLFDYQKGERFNIALHRPKPVVPDTVRGQYAKLLNRIGKNRVTKAWTHLRCSVEAARYIRINVGLERLP